MPDAADEAIGLGIEEGVAREIDEIVPARLLRRRIAALVGLIDISALRDEQLDGFDRIRNTTTADLIAPADTGGCHQRRGLA